VQSVTTERASAVLVPSASAAATNNTNADPEMSFRSLEAARREQFKKAAVKAAQLAAGCQMRNGHPRASPTGIGSHSIPHGCE
jgi:hypothetical protein